MKNIVYITENLDFFSDSGAKIKTLNTLRCLSSEFHITVLSLNSSNVINHKKLKTFKNIDFEYVVDKNIEIPIKKRFLELIYFYIKGIPYYFFQYKNKKFNNLVSKKIKEIEPNIIHIDHLTMAQYLPKKKNCVWIYEEHNIEYKLRFQMAKFSKKIGYHWIIWLFEGILLYFKEINTWKKFDHIFAISKEDQIFILNKTKRNNVFLQNIYVSINPRKKQPNNKNILFIGDLEWLPNRNGVEWFIKKIFPKLKNVKLNIVGKVDKKFKKNNQQKNIIFWDYQKKIDKFYENNEIFIVPLHIGEGIRLKILDAFSKKIPVVSTQQGTKGTFVKHKSELYIASSDQEFSNYINNILNKKNETKTILNRAILYLKSNHSYEENKKFIKKYQKFIN